MKLKELHKGSPKSYLKYVKPPKGSVLKHAGKEEFIDPGKELEDVKTKATNVNMSSVPKVNSNTVELVHSDRRRRVQGL
jgi:hypothetical protein